MVTLEAERRLLRQADLERLARFDSGGAPVLSVYLGLDPARQVERAYRAAFRDLVRDARERLGGAGREELDGEVARVNAWLEGQAPRGLGLAIFSCSPRGLWQDIFLPVEVRDRLTFDPQPDITPLVEIVDDYERYAVALVDKERSRLFTIFMGEIEETERFADWVPGKHQQGGPSQANFQRHHEAHVYRHLKHVAGALAELQRRRSFDRLVLAGPEEVTGELRWILPRALAHRVVAVIPGETSARPAEILERTLAIERQVEREAEDRLVDQILEAAGAGGRATCGVSPTLEAVWLDQVQTLIVADWTRVPGASCPNCGRLAAPATRACPACGHAMEAAEDLIPAIVDRVIEQDGAAEIVQDQPARRLVERCDGLAALVRFR
jgi:peptide subunit release factor 1 (eRF1)